MQNLNDIHVTLLRTCSSTMDMSGFPAYSTVEVGAAFRVNLKSG